MFKLVGDIIEFKKMGLFFENEDSKYTQRESKHWPLSPTNQHVYSIKGTFSEISPSGKIAKIDIFANDSEIFY